MQKSSIINNRLLKLYIRVKKYIKNHPVFQNVIVCKLIITLMEISFHSPPSPAYCFSLLLSL